MATEQHAIILLFLYCISTSVAAVSQNHGNLPRRMSKNKDGSCVKGQPYKMDCNTCHCVAGNLLCTKMACIKAPGLKKDKNFRSSGKTCAPGTFYKDGCRRCFCSNEERLFCGPEDCESADKLPKSHEAIHVHSSFKPAEQHLLPTLPNHSAQCNPGSTYRVDCNTCLCLANGNLICGQLFCPSHDDVHERDAKKMSGKPCVGIGLIYQGYECLQCWCVDGTNVCQAILGCVPAGTQVPNELSSPDQCSPGMVYKQGCNRCFCNENRSLQCTSKNCLNEWVDYTLR